MALACNDRHSRSSRLWKWQYDSGSTGGGTSEFTGVGAPPASFPRTRHYSAEIPQAIPTTVYRTMFGKLDAVECGPPSQPCKTFAFRNGRVAQRVDRRIAGDRWRRQKPFESCGFCDAHQKTPGTLAPGVFHLTVEPESLLPESSTMRTRAR